MKQLAGTLLVFMVAVSLFDSCNKPDTIGADFVPGEEGFELRYTDSLTIVAETVQTDSVIVHGALSSDQLVKHLIGAIDDPVFGTSAASLYSTYRISYTSPDFREASFDSLVLALSYSSGDHYGDLTASQNIKVYRMQESPVYSTTYYSGQSFLTDPTPVGDVDFIPNFEDSIVLSIEDTMITNPPQLRIRLDDALGEEFLNSMVINGTDTIFNAAIVDTDTLLIYSGNTNFNRFFNGLYITPGSANSAIINFNTYSAFSILRLYYTKDGDQRFFDFPINFQSTKVSNFGHDYASAPISPFLNDPEKGDSLLFVQSMSGVNTKLSFPTLEQLGDILVNKAELVVTVADVQDTSIYGLPPQLVLQEAIDETELDYISDVWVAISASTDTIRSSFGGRPVLDTLDNGEIELQYRLNLSGHLQDIIRGAAFENLYLTTYPKAEVPYRVVLGGPGHSEYRMKLELIYTKL